MQRRPADAQQQQGHQDRHEALIPPTGGPWHLRVSKWWFERWEPGHLGGEQKSGKNNFGEILKNYKLYVRCTVS